MTDAEWRPAGTGQVLYASPGGQALFPPDPKVEKLAGEFDFLEGPVWMPGGFLIFSDIPRNRIYRWDSEGGAAVYLEPSGFYDTHEKEPPGPQPGSNGLTLDAGGCVIACEHGNRRLTRREADGRVQVLADRFEGRRLNSPNDVVVHPDGSIFFTDPPYGLAGKESDPRRELPFSALFRIGGGGLEAAYTELKRPNGLAFSPDGRSLYLGNSDAERRVWLRFPYAGGRLGEPDVFYDVTKIGSQGNPDGMKVDRLGNVYCTGPGGLWIFSPEAALLARVEFPELPANLHWGDADAMTLYVTARTSLYRIRMANPGVRPLEWLPVETAPAYGGSK